ncbi:MAG: peptidoglycan DD-metalloendopeptidase family protein [Ruminococcus sp.]|nr:peptidoglycan DD-metalloendopeptidase family protein [Ruminococcus sp.]
MNNKNVFKRMVSFAVSLTLIASTAHAYPFHVDNRVKAKTLAEIQAEREENKQKIDEINQKLDALYGKQESQKEYQQELMNQIALYKANIESLNNEITAISNEISEAEANIKAIDDSIVQMQADIDEGVEKFKARLYSMYVSTDNSLAGVVLGSTSFYDMVVNKEMLKRIADYDKELIDGILKNIDDIENSRKELENQKRILEMKQTDLENRKKEKNAELDDYNRKMAETEEVLQMLKNEENSLNMDKNDLNQIIADLDAEDAKIQAEIKRQQELLLQQQQNQNQNNNNGGGNSGPIYVTPPSGGGFMWPTPGFYYISSRFEFRWGKLHGGIDIGDAGIHGGAVVASKSGTVAMVCNSCTHNYYKTYSCGCGGGYGNYVNIIHDSTFSTQYSHLTSVTVSPGEYVQQGQVIGYVGCTGYSMGSHLHYEIYANDTRIDPLNYVSP